MMQGNLGKKVVVSVIAAMLVAVPVAAQGIPTAGPSGDPLRFWQGYSVGTYVMVGGVLFLVTLGGLVLADGDEKSKSPTPAPTPPPVSTTTSTAG